MSTAYYAQSSDRSFVSSELTRGPWDGESQHAGPPAALVARAAELCAGIGAGPRDRQVGRITLEILRPVPIAELTVEAEVIRPGRRVDLVEVVLAAAGEELIRARSWRLLRDDVELPPGLGSTEAGSPPQLAGRPSGASGRPGPPEALPDNEEFFPTGHDVGYQSSMDVRFERGGFDQPGPATCWMRMRQPLVAGEQPSPLQRVLAAADSGNGISSALDYRTHLFINVDLTVHLHRMPAGEWVGLDALTIPEPTGLGMSDTMLFDQAGPIGRACQTLLIAERPAPEG